jgi:selenocysteine lyase/cysteine desulfurase
VSPWLLAAERTGAEVRWLDFDPDDGCTLGPIEEVLSSSTRLVAVTAASNAVGTVPDLGEIVGTAREAGAFTVVDAVHHVPHRPTFFAELGADALLCSPYKFYGPHAGVLALAESAWGLAPERIRPAPAGQPGHWESGTASFESLAGVSAAVGFIGSFGEGRTRRDRLVSALSVMDAHTEALGERFLAGIGGMDRVTLHGIDDGRPRTPTFAITVEGHAPAAVAEHLGSAGIQVWAGHFYALEVLRRLGRLETGGVVRIGFLAYQTEAEVDRLLEVLDRL